MRSLHSTAAVVVKSKQPIEFWKTNVPFPEPESINVEVLKAGVCGTDVHLWKGEHELPFAYVLGHEGIAKIYELGERVTTDHAGQAVAVGDVVYWCPMRPCHSCFNCTIAGDTPGCSKGSNFTPADQPTAASYTKIATLPKSVSFYRLDITKCPPEAVIALGCSLPAVLQGLSRLGKIEFDSTVVVQGAGAVGLAAVMLAELAGAKKIIVIEGNKKRMAMSKRFGATDVIDVTATSTADRLKKVQDITGAAGVDVVIEASGNIKAFEEGVGLLQRNGRYLLIGTWAGKGSAPVDPFNIVHKALKIVGTTYGAPHDYYKAMKLAERYHTRFPLTECITHEFGLRETEEAFNIIMRGEAVKVVVNPH